jgi:hypothetical protein
MRESPVFWATVLVVAIGIPIQHLVLGWPLLSWGIDLAILGASLAVLGAITNQRLDGVLVDERNKLSLSRFQTAAWTVVVIGSFVAFVMIRLEAGVADPLAVAVPEELWLAIGIATTALIGTPIIHQVKQQSDKQPDPSQLATMTTQLGGTALTTRGYLVLNEKPSEAAWSDMTKGEEVGNAATLDIGKIQMFWFSTLLLVVYALAVGALISDAVAASDAIDDAAEATRVLADGLSGLPELSSAFVALLGISNGTYLAYKAVPHTQPKP